MYVLQLKVPIFGRTRPNSNQDEKEKVKSLIYLCNYFFISRALCSEWVCNEF